MPSLSPLIVFLETAPFGAVISEPMLTQWLVTLHLDCIHWKTLLTVSNLADGLGPRTFA